MQVSKTYIQATERIYRGVVAKPHSWPWIAKLKVTLKIIFVFLVVSPVFCEHGGIWLGLLYMHDDLAMQFQWIWYFLSKSFSHLAVSSYYGKIILSVFCSSSLLHSQTSLQFGETHFSHSLDISAFFFLNAISSFMSLFIIETIIGCVRPSVCHVIILVAFFTF